MTHFWALSDDSRVPEVDFVHLFGYLGVNFRIWMSIWPLRFNFMHSGVIREPLHHHVKKNRE